MNFIDTEPGVYSMGSPGVEQMASGNPITIQSAAAPFTELLIFGKTSPDGTPSPENPVALDTAGSSGQVNVDVGGGNLFNLGSFTFTSGTSTTGYSLAPNNIIEFFKALANGDYCVSYTPKSDGTLGSSAGKIAFVGENNETLINTTNKFTMTDEVRNNLKRVVLFGYYPSKINTVDDFMVNAGSTALPWEPYVTPQNLVVSTPTGLPGVPTTGEEYTYIDADGTKRIADSVEYFSDGTGRYVQRTVLYNAKDLVWGPDFYGTEPNRIYRYSSLKHTELINRASGLSNRFVWKFSSAVSGNFSTEENKIRVVFEQPFDSTDALMQWFTENETLFLLQLATPIITPLSTEQIAAFKALTTYEPTTVVKNDAECWMQVGYYSGPAIQRLVIDAQKINRY